MHNEPQRFDLHCHSTVSDGALAPAELIARAVKNGVDVLALTDHDALDGLPEAFAAASEQPITVIAGVEISVTWSGRVIHILGLAIDPSSQQLIDGLQGLRGQREQRAKLIGQRFASIGIANAEAGARALAGGDIVTRSHFAQFLVQQGIVSNFKAAFSRYLKPGRPAYVASEWVPLEQSLAWIQQAGGQAVIAHPARYGLSGVKLQALIQDFKDSGGVGLEVVSSSHNPAENRRMGELAIQYGLLASAGSDFHSPQQEWCDLGRVATLPAANTPIWQDWPVYQGKKTAQPTQASV